MISVVVTHEVHWPDYLTRPNQCKMSYHCDELPNLWSRPESVFTCTILRYDNAEKFCFKCLLGLDLCNNFSTETGAKEWTPCWNIHVQLVVVHQTYLMINKVYNKGRPLSDTILIRYLYVCHLTKQAAWPSNCPHTWYCSPTFVFFNWHSHSWHTLPLTYSTIR
mgnify:CR=1 FL=1